MRNVSSAWRAKVDSGEDVVYLKYIDFTLADGTKLSVDNSDLWSNGFKFEDSVSQDNSFDIGSAIINSASVTLNNFDDKYTDYVFEGATAICYIGLHFDETEANLTDEDANDIVDEKDNALTAKLYLEGTEKIRICTMTVTDAPYQNSVLIDLSLEDNMRKFDKDYSESSLEYPATRLQIVRDICNTCGVTLQSTSFDRGSYIVQNRPSDDSLTCRQVLSWVAMLGCQWAKCDEYGRLTLDWYNTSPEDSDYIKIDTTSGLTVNLEDVVITGVRVAEYADSTSTSADEDTLQPETYLAGNEGYVIEISGNKLIGIGDGQTVASMIGEKCIGMKFRPLSAGILTDVRLEAGDPIKVTSSKGVIYTTHITSLTLQPGNYENIANNAKSATRNSSTQYSQMTQIAVEARKSIQVERSNREKAIEALGTRINESSGVYTTEEKQPDGSYIYYLHNKSALSESDIVWKMTAEAWGVSTDGGKTYNAGMTVDGDTIVRILTATGVNADWINTGALSIKDDDGNTIFEANMDTKTVSISGDRVIIGGKSATSAISDATSAAESAKSAAESANDTAKEALNAAALAKNMTMQLSNDYQSIPVDKGGNYNTFPSCTTTPQVMYGTQDITSNCTFTVTKSDNVAGSWNDSTRMYTVTALSADSGWVDIEATYLNKLNVTKRFTLAKLYAGADGESGESVTIKSTAVEYQAGTSGTTKPSDTWSTTIPAVAEGSYLWARTTVTYSDGTSTISYSVARQGADGAKGDKGDDGTSVSIVSASVTYQTSDDGVTPPEQKNFNLITDTGENLVDHNNNILYTQKTEWSTSTPSVKGGEYLWTKTVVSYSDGTETTTYSVARQGVNGTDGTDGTPGKDGYVHFAYATSADGAESFSVSEFTGATYIGVYSDHTQADSTDYTKYAWSLIKGDKGDTGADGADGTSYSLQLSTPVIKVMSGPTLLPAVFTVHGTYNVGTSTALNDYAGRFVVEKSKDSATWATVYTSSKDESTVTFQLKYSDTDDSSTATINGSTVSLDIYRQLSALRVTLYAPGGTTQIIDRQMISIVVDIDALTQDEVFDVLTNGGEAKGLYMENNQLYISFTYAKGGTLKLGGADNGNGELDVYGESGNLIAVIDKEGYKGYGSDGALKIRLNNSGLSYYINGKGSPFKSRTLTGKYTIPSSKFTGGGKSVCTITGFSKYLDEFDGISRDQNLFATIYTSSPDVRAIISGMEAPGGITSTAMYSLATFGIGEASLTRDMYEYLVAIDSIECSYIAYLFNNGSTRYLPPTSLEITIFILY